MRNKHTNIVIGGGGFVGTKLCFALKKKEPVLSIDRSPNLALKSVPQENCEVENIQKLVKLLKGGENIFILIGQNHPGFSKKEELKKIDNIISAIDLKSTKKIFYFSSIHVYGDIKEKAAEGGPCQPIDEYGEFKLESEKLFSYLDVPTVVLRPTNIYGSPQNKGFIGIVFEKILQGQEIELNGNGQQKKDFVLVDDVAAAVVAIKDLADGSDTVNISTGKSYPLVEVVKKIESITRKKIKLRFNKSATGKYTSDSFIANDKLRDKYQFTPAYSVDNGLEITYKRYLDGLIND